jgi:gamma-glutamylcyclotransferase
MAAATGSASLGAIRNERLSSFCLSNFRTLSYKQISVSPIPTVPTLVHIATSDKRTIALEPNFPSTPTSRVQVVNELVYFAYGANMITARIRERVPSATPIGIGYLVGHALRWNKRSSIDGSGKCDAEATDRDDDTVWGVLFTIAAPDKSALDAAEGLDAGYTEKRVKILTEYGPIPAIIYCAVDKDPSLRPYHWYKDLVITGAREHGLPNRYRSRLELEPTVAYQTHRLGRSAVH